MAYQTRHRDPLLDSRMQEAIERRGRELLGIILVALAVALAAVLASYTPQDPSFFSATDERDDSTDDAKLAFVVGDLDKAVPSIKMRFVGFGLSVDLSAWCESICHNIDSSNEPATDKDFDHDHRPPYAA